MTQPTLETDRNGVNKSRWDCYKFVNLRVD